MNEAASAPDLERTLVAGASGMGVRLEPAQVASLLALVRELIDWSARFNLTAIREPADIVRKHLLDSLSVLPYLTGASVADVGTGAGFPGLPLAIADPKRRFTLIESTGKKVRFVEHAAAALGLANVAVVNARAEAFEPSQRFDCVVARALSSLAEFVRFAGHLAAPRGRLLAMKGRLPEAEMREIPKGWRVAAAHALAVPGLEAERHLVILERAADARSRSR